MTSEKKIGYFGGTFDPIHHGHLNLAIELMEKRGLDEIWFIPAQLNPLKINAPPVPFHHRSEMIRLAIQDIPSFFLKEFEETLPIPSYTIHSLRALTQENANKQSFDRFYLLLGEDSLDHFDLWYALEEILTLADLLIGSRSEVPTLGLEKFSSTVRKAIQKGWTVTNLMDISSQQIRKRLQQRKHYCGHLLPYLVFQYIQENQLYL